MDADVTVGAVVMRSIVGDTDANLACISSFVDRAARGNVDILCFPELCLTGYSVSPRIQDEALTMDSPAVASLVDLARRTGICILAGFVERERGAVYATHLAVSKDGILGAYRKLHLGPPEHAIFSPGNDIAVFQTHGTRFGVQLCYDAHFPELSTLYAVKGADILFMPHASPNGTSESKLESWLRHLTARAYDNGVFVLACNQRGDNGWGLHFPGLAVILSPDGKVMAQSGNDEDSLTTATLRRADLEGVRGHRMRYFLPHRRPELYAELTDRKKTS